MKEGNLQEIIDLGNLIPFNLFFLALFRLNRLKTIAKNY